MLNTKTSPSKRSRGEDRPVDLSQENETEEIVVDEDVSIVKKPKQVPLLDITDESTTPVLSTYTF
jgi:hypothetical protein